MPERGSGAVSTERVRHPDVHLFAAHVARRLQCSHVIELGCGDGKALAKLYPEFKVVGLDEPPIVASCRASYGFMGHWFDWDPNHPDLPAPLTDLLDPLREILPSSVVVCADVIERAADPDAVLANLHELMEYAPAAIVTTADPDVDAVRARAESAGLRVDFSGLTLTDNLSDRKDTSLLVLANNHTPPMQPAPDDFRVVALLAAYNEEDVIEPSMDRLVSEGIEVYLIDNWSTDRTVELARNFLGRGLIGIEQFPPDGPSGVYDWAPMLARKEQLATELGAHWYIHTDVDEIRLSPWPGVTLRDALHHVDRLGFTAVDYNSVQFRPIDDGFVDRSSFEDYFHHFNLEFFSNYQLRTWKFTGRRVMTTSGGHNMFFAGRRVYPYDFLYKHYGVRSQRHGEKKIFRDRQGRLSAAERAVGWHRHIAEMDPGEKFLWDPSELLRFDEHETHRRFTVELLASIGPEQRDAWARQPLHKRRRPPLWRRIASPVRRQVARIVPPVRRY
jgi:hypothetical protein